MQAALEFYTPEFYGVHIMYMCGRHRIGARALREQQNVFLLAPLEEGT